MATVQDIIVDRLIAKIENDKRVPWNKPFQAACMNWYSNREYRGVNKFLLPGGEYITPKQLQAYNTSHKTNFWFDKGTPAEIVVFYSNSKKSISPGLANSLIAQGKTRGLRQVDGAWVLVSWFLRYYRVYDIAYIREIINPQIKADPKYDGSVFQKETVMIGKTPSTTILRDDNNNALLLDGISPEDIKLLQPRIGVSVFDVHTPAEDIVAAYTKASGVTVRHDSPHGAYYTEISDSVYLPTRNYFKSSEAYYRVVFHELIHSTGIDSRLNRSCFKDYSSGKIERSKEELIAEVGGLLLASEAGFREDTTWADNSLEYVAGWCDWMAHNKSEVLSGMLAAEKAKNYILTCGEDVSNTAERAIDDSDASPEDSLEVIDDEGVVDQSE